MKVHNCKTHLQIDIIRYLAHYGITTIRYTFFEGIYFLSQCCIINAFFLAKAAETVVVAIVCNNTDRVIGVLVWVSWDCGQKLIIKVNDPLTSFEPI